MVSTFLLSQQVGTDIIHGGRRRVLRTVGNLDRRKRFRSGAMRELWALGESKEPDNRSEEFTTNDQSRSTRDRST